MNLPEDIANEQIVIQLQLCWVEWAYQFDQHSLEPIRLLYRVIYRLD